MGLKPETKKFVEKVLACGGYCDIFYNIITYVHGRLGVYKLNYTCRFINKNDVILRQYGYDNNFSILQLIYKFL